ncbi:MAG: TonB-dependent receptor, partial [Kiritimatiellales bacterium]
NWLPTDSLKFFTGVERTYRYPFFDEQAIYSGWGNAFNKDLKPETGVNYEAGLAFTPRTNITIQATVFRTDMKDEIAWGSTQNENLDETTHRGLEISAEYRNNLFAVKAFYTWLQSEFTTDDASTGAVKGNEIPWVPQNRLDVSLALFLTDALTFTTYMNYTGSMVPLGDNTNTSTEPQSEYAIFDLLLDYRLPLRKTDVTLFAGIDNLFATEYDYLVTDYGTAGYYPAPERTWKAGVSMTF